MKKIVSVANYITANITDPAMPENIDRLVNSPTIVIGWHAETVCLPETGERIGAIVERAERTTDEFGFVCIARWWTASLDAGEPDCECYSTAQDARQAVLDAYYWAELGTDGAGVWECPADTHGTPCNGRCDICPYGQH